MKFIKLVKSFAYKRKDVIQRLQSNESYQFYRHITKILANRDTIEVDHWKTECYSFCSWIMDLKIKPNNEPVDSYLLMEYFFTFGETQEIFSKTLDRQYKDLHEDKERPNKNDDSVLYNQYKNFCIQLAKMIETGELTKTKFNSLFLEYFGF